MSIVQSIDKITAWVEQTVCSKVKMKLPAEDKQATDGGYDYQLAAPAAFPLFVPTKDRLPPRIIAPFPSVCVRLVESKDHLIAGKRVLKVQFCLSVWDPGRHGPDVYLPVDNTRGQFVQIPGEDAQKWYRRDGDGWRDAWNFMDTAIRELENAEYIDGLRLVKEQTIDFGPLAEQDAIPDYYPFWYAWIEFQIEEILQRSPKPYDDFL